FLCMPRYACFILFPYTTLFRSRKSLFFGGLLMIVGSLLLSIDTHQFFFFGLAFIIIGTGFFKPNISTMVGELYKDGDSRRDAGRSEENTSELQSREKLVCRLLL